MKAANKVISRFQCKTNILERAKWIWRTTEMIVGNLECVEDANSPE